jgi:hypothetical protein
MKKNKKEKNQVTMLIVAIVIALIVMAITAFFIAKAIKGGDYVNGKNKDTSQSVPDFSSVHNSDIDKPDSSVVDSSESDSSSEADVTTHKYAVDYINYTSQQLLAEWNNSYENEGYVDGGYTIYNKTLAPNIYFVVPTNGSGVIVDGKLDAIVVVEGGKVNKDVTVGMTYQEIKDKIGASIKPADDKTEEDCTVAVIEGNDYIITVTFDGAGGKSSRAMIKSK